MRITINYKTFRFSEAALVKLNEIIQSKDVVAIEKNWDNKWVDSKTAHPTLVVNQTTEWEGESD